MIKISKLTCALTLAVLSTSTALLADSSNSFGDEETNNTFKTSSQVGCTSFDPTSSDNVKDISWEIPGLFFTTLQPRLDNSVEVSMERKNRESDESGVSPFTTVIDLGQIFSGHGFKQEFEEALKPGTSLERQSKILKSVMTKEQIDAFLFPLQPGETRKVSAVFVVEGGIGMFDPTTTELITVVEEKA